MVNHQRPQGSHSTYAEPINHYQRQRFRRNLSIQPEPHQNNSTMERPTLKRRRPSNKIKPLLLTAILTPTIKARHLRSSRHLSDDKPCYQNTSIIPPYLPSYPYTPSQLTTANNLIYQCKPFPFSGWCPDYTPGDISKPWGNAWILVGECQDPPPQYEEGSLEQVVLEVMEELSAATSDIEKVNPAPVEVVDEETSMTLLSSSLQCSSYMPYSSEEIFTAEDQVFVDSKLYKCKVYPADAWCSLGGYEPGTGMYWNMAWEEVGECQMDEAGGNAGAGDNALNNGNPPDLTSFSQGVNEGQPDCAPLYNSKVTYGNKDLISFEQENYECLVPQWCNKPEYAPYVGNTYTAAAWQKKEACFGTVTAMPSPAPIAPSDNPTEQPTEPPSSEAPTAWPTPPSSEAAKLPLCAPPYSSIQVYVTNSVISYDQHNYKCNVPRWCNQENYAPSDWNTFFAAAWIKKEECLGETVLSESPTLAPNGWVNLSNEVIVVPLVEEEPNESSFLADPEEEVETPEEIRTRRPSASPIEARYAHLPPCEPLFTQGHDYELKELISFQNHNYRCENTAYCNNVRYAPRVGDENAAVAWWKIEECYGEATRHPTPRPTPRLAERPPSGPDKAEIAHNTYYSSRVPMPILLVLNENKVNIQKKVLISLTPENEWEYSKLYTFDDFIVALGVLTEHSIVSPFFLGGFGTQSNDEAKLYGLVNIAAFLAQSMAESIKFDTCDEANWDFVNNHYPLSNACGQGGASYQDMSCTEEERHMECPVKKDMKVTAYTHAKWLGGADGAPGPLYCAPKTDRDLYTGVWDHLYKCNRPHEDPPETCDVYEGQNAGRYDNSFPAANGNLRTDVEGCCWWGRGVIQTRGTCEIGKINHFLGKGAENSPYPTLDFCEDPEALCTIDSRYSELKWVAGLATWTMRVQSYDQGGWGYIPELIKFVDGGMSDDSFIEAISSILIRGCHDDSCGEVQPSTERSNNFRVILEEVFALRTLSVDAGRTRSPTNKPTRRTRQPVGTEPTTKPTKRSRKPTVSPTPFPTVTQMPSFEVTKKKRATSSPVSEGSPTGSPTQWRPWYYNYDTQSCVNDGKQPSWLKQADFFGIKDECCKMKTGVDYDACMGKVTYSWSAQNAKVEVAEDKNDCPASFTGWAASSDCRSYFMCQNGSRTGQMYECSDPNQLFDEEESKCRHKSEVTCKSKNNALAFKSEDFSTPKPTRRPNTRRPTPASPIASLWFGVSVTSKIKDDYKDDKDESPEDR